MSTGTLLIITTYHVLIRPPPAPYDTTVLFGILVELCESRGVYFINVTNIKKTFKRSLQSSVMKTYVSFDVEGGGRT